MSARLGVLCLVLAIGWPSLASTESPPLRVLVDGSGSMRGFESSGALTGLVERLESAGTRTGWTPATRVFHAETPSDLQLSAWNEWNGAPIWGETTPLVAALKRGVQGAQALILVTDNFQDPGGSGSSEGVAELYAALSEAQIARGHLIPELLEFKGNVDLGVGGEVPGRKEGKRLRDAMVEQTPPHFVDSIGTPRWVKLPDGRSFWKTAYSGRRGLAVYLILLNPALASEFEALSDAISGERSLPSLLVWPLAGDAVGLRESVGSADRAALECAGMTLAELPEPNLILESRDGGAYGLRPRPELVYDPRKPGRFVARIEPFATVGHVSVRNRAAGCESSATLGVGPLQVEAAKGNEDILLPLSDERRRGEVLPPRLLSPIQSGDDSEGHAVFVSFDVPPLVGPRVPEERIDGQVSAHFELLVELAAGSVALDDRVRGRFFTARPTDLARIYSPEDLIQRLSREGLTIRIPVSLPAEVFFRPPPPRPETQPFPWGKLLAVLGLFAALWFVLRPLGFIVPLRFTGSKRALGVPVGGLLRRVHEDRRKLNVGGARTLQVARESVWARRIVLYEDGDQVGKLSRGGETPVPGTNERVEWLTASAKAELATVGLYDEVAS